MSISFSDLSHCLYFHQLYEAFVMLIKKEDSSDEEYLDDEMRVHQQFSEQSEIFVIAERVLEAWS